MAFPISHLPNKLKNNNKVTEKQRKRAKATKVDFQCNVAEFVALHYIKLLLTFNVKVLKPSFYSS